MNTVQVRYNVCIFDETKRIGISFFASLLLTLVSIHLPTLSNRVYYGDPGKKGEKKSRVTFFIFTFSGRYFSNETNAREKGSKSRERKKTVDL